MDPYAYCFQNPINFIDPTGMEGESSDEWLKVDGVYRWDDRVTDQATATQYHGENATYVGVNKTVSTVRNGETVDSVTLNDGGTVTKNGTTLGVNSSEKFRNQYGSTFIPRQTEGSFFSIGFDGALLGGFGLQVGLVSDAVGDSSFFINFNGNLGFGLGLGWNAGTATPTEGHQFLNTDFDGNSAGYNVGVETPVFDASWTRGGNIDNNWHATDKMNPSNFGKMDRGYRTTQTGFGPGGSWSAGGIWSYGTTKVF